jgi:hypothetical protein
LIAHRADPSPREPPSLLVSFAIFAPLREPFFALLPRQSQEFQRIDLLSPIVYSPRPSQPPTRMLKLDRWQPPPNASTSAAPPDQAPPKARLPECPQAPLRPCALRHRPHRGARRHLDPRRRHGALWASTDRPINSPERSAVAQRFHPTHVHARSRILQQRSRSGHGRPADPSILNRSELANGIDIAIEQHRTYWLAYGFNMYTR